jgi:hypothetical protein
MPEGKKIYFLHIPKTSGIKMQYELLNASSGSPLKNKPKVYSQDANRTQYAAGEFEFVFDPSIANSYDIICGHFARNPIDIIDNLTTFSIIREPFQQYLSLAKYAAQQASLDFSEEFLESFLSNDNEINTSFEGMSGCDNPQSCFLFSKIACIEHEPYIDSSGNLSKPRYQSFFIEKPSSYLELDQRLDKMIIGTLENRDMFIGRINKILFDLYGIKIKTNDSVINPTPKPTFKISKNQKLKIYSKIEIDIELYSKIKESEHE